MIKNFEELKKQLAELSSVINSFKSEAVQLKIVELIFRGGTPDEEEPEDTQTDQTTVKKKSKPRNKTGKKKASAKSSSGKKTAKVGPATILSELIDDGFFNKPKTISAIITHSDSKKARKFKANELSSPLARFVRDGRLNREKNQDNQYEYTKG